MSTAASEVDWLDAEPIELGVAPAPRAKKRRVKKSARKAVKVTPGKKLPMERLRGRAMFRSVAGRKRTWACDGEFVFFRRKNCYAKDPHTGATLVNDRAIERHDEFIRKGDYTYIETQDDVEICKVNEQSPFWRKGLYLGTMSTGMVRRQVELAACKRDWALYADALDEYAGRIKGAYDPGTAQLAWKESIEYLEVMIRNRGGPTPQECGAALQNVRMKRGQSKGRRIILPS